MSFVHPILAGVGVACVAIPILIHLLMRRRRKPVMWAAMRFLLEAYREHRRRLRLEQVLLLATRCLLVALIALGLGRPMLGGASLLAGHAPVTLYILIDDSLAASAADEGGGTAFDRHRARAGGLLDQLDAASGDRAGLITLAGPPRALVAPASPDASAVKTLLNGLVPADSAADIPGALSMLSGVIAGGAPDAAARTVVVVLSDFLTGSADTERALAALPASGVTVLASAPAETGRDNVTITGVEPLRPILIAPPRVEAAPAERTPVTVRLRRTGPGVGSPAVTTVRVRVAGADDRPGPPAGQSVVRWPAGASEAQSSIDVGAPSSAAGTLVLTASIDPDAVAGDNTWRRTLEVRPSLRVGIVTPRRTTAAPSVRDFDPADWIRVALDPHHGERGAPGSGPVRDVDLVEIDPASVDAARLSGLDAIVLPRPDALADAAWRHVRRLADTGGLVLVFPPPQLTVHTWPDAMTRELELDWTIGREARSYAEPATIAADAPPRTGDDRALLAMISGELGALAAPVRVLRVLPVEAPPAAVALVLSDGAPLIVAAAPASRRASPGEAGPDPLHGLVVLVAVPASFDWTDLPARPLMVPLLHELVVQGVARSRGDWSALAGARPQAPARATELRPVGEGAPLPLGRDGRTADAIRTAGVWRAVDDRGGARGLVAVNADPAAGRTDPQPASAIQAWLGSALGGHEVQWLPANAAVATGGPTLRERLDRGQDRAPYAALLLAAALALAVVELGLARWFSHAVVPTPSGGGTP